MTPKNGRTYSHTKDTFDEYEANQKVSRATKGNQNAYYLGALNGCPSSYVEPPPRVEDNAPRIWTAWRRGYIDVKLCFYLPTRDEVRAAAAKTMGCKPTEIMVVIG